MTSEKPSSSKGKFKYYPPQYTAKCNCCKEVSQKLDTILDILGEHKILLDGFAAQKVAMNNIMSIFPVNTEEKLKELDHLLAMQSEPYIRQIKNVIAGNVERNLHLVLGQNIITNFNIEGIFGKKRLRDFKNVIAALTDVLSNFSDEPDKILRAAFQRQKKKYFKQNSRNNHKANIENSDNIEEL